MILENQIIKVTKENFFKHKPNSNIKFDDEFIEFEIKQKLDFNPWKTNEDKQKYKNQFRYGITFIDKNNKRFLLDWVGITTEDIFYDEIHNKWVKVTEKMLKDTAISAFCDYYDIFMSAKQMGLI